MRAAEAIAEVRKVQSAFKVLATYLQLSAHLFTPEQPLQDKLSVDYIVVGAGSSGAVIANRLTEDRNTTVLLLEAGGNPPIESVLPGLAPYLSDTPYCWNFIPKKGRSTFFKNDVPHLLQGKMLGGTTSLNYLNYIRGAPKDYDAWAELVNDDSWGYKKLVKYFKRSEDLRNWHDYSSKNRKYHGNQGYIDVTKEDNNATHLYLKAFQELGNNIVEDLNGATPLGYTQPMNIIDNGYRQSTAKYLSNKIMRENLMLYRNTMAVKILFDDTKTAVGVAAINNNRKFTFYAKKEVIVAAGVFNTPKLLMLSQIGPKEELSKMNIDCISDLPVGKNLQYHNSVATVIKMGTLRYQERLNARKFPTPVVLGAVALDNSASRNFGSLSYLVNSKLFLIFCAFSFGYKNKYCDKFNDDAQDSEILFSVISLLSPKTRGSVTLKSVDYLDPPVIDLGMFTKSEDLDHLAEYIEYYMRVANTSTFRSVGAKPLYLDLPDSNAVWGSIDYWKSYAANMGTPFQSYAGTCSMGKVVDTELRVFGVQKLRVADASIIPLITSGTMDIPSVMIGEKAAELIKGTCSSQIISDSASDDDNNSSSSDSEENSDQESKFSKENDNGTELDSTNSPNNHRNKKQVDGEEYVTGESDEQILSVTITREEITEYIQEIVSELQVRVNVVITELDKNGTKVGVTYIKEKINLSVREVEESRQIFLDGINENGSYDTTYIDLFVQKVVQIFKEKQVVMIKEIDENTNEYTDTDKVVIRANISYCTETIVQYIGQKRNEIIQRLTQNRSENNVGVK